VSYSESVVSFRCAGEQLIGIVTTPENATKYGVVIVVGGPQFRIGSHRQFVLLARSLGERGITTLRFDYRGMGDSSGDLRDFMAIDEDIRAAVDTLQNANPKLERIILWGLCDAASASLFYAHKDSRIAGLVLANPWVRTDVGEAQAYLNHYYRARFLDMVFWKKILRGHFDFFASARSFFEMMRKAMRKTSPEAGARELPLRERMYASWASFNGEVLVLLSGEDLTAQEFSSMVKASSPWRELIDGPRVTKHNIPLANHTFSREEWRDEVANVTKNWILAL
jgi:uncharacterized protein